MYAAKKLTKKFNKTEPGFKHEEIFLKNAYKVIDEVNQILKASKIKFRFFFDKKDFEIDLESTLKEKKIDKLSIYIKLSSNNVVYEYSGLLGQETSLKCKFTDESIKKVVLNIIFDALNKGLLDPSELRAIYAYTKSETVPILGR